MNIIHRALMIVLLVLASATAQAVHLSESDQGDALILPYWTAQGGNDTLLTVRNSHDAPVAIKVRVLGADGAEIHALNLYLDARDAWTAGFTNFDGARRLFSLDPSCALPMLAQEAAFGTPQLELSAGHGYLEIIEMGVAEPGVATDEEGAWQSCSDLMLRLEAGPWLEMPNDGMLPPAGRVSATAEIIDVPAGGMTTVEAIALAGFSNIAQHTGYEIPVPNLTSAHDTGTPAGTTESQICLPSGCRTDTWALPVGAVAAVLSVASMETNFVISPEIGAQAELVIVRPLERYEGVLDGDFRIDAQPTLSIFDRSGEVVVPELRKDIICPCPPPPPHTVLPPDVVVNVVSFNARQQDIDEERITPILGAPIRPNFTLESREAKAGYARVRFDNVVGAKLVSDNGEVFAGEPVVAIGFQQFSNGVVVVDGNPVLSNYRGAQRPVRRRLLLPGD